MTIHQLYLRAASYFSKTEFSVRRDLAILAVAFFAPFFLFLGHVGLIDPDEGRYSEIPREMLEKCDFITPTLNYVAYFEKPPLHYWLTAISFKVFGLNEFSARFASALMGFLCVLLVYRTAEKLFGRREGFLSALVLGSSTGFVAQSRINLTDMTLTFFLSAALCCFIIAADDRERRKGLFWYLFYLFSGLAMLAKGLIGIVLPVGIIFTYLAMFRRWHLLKKMRIVSGILLFLAVTAPWFVLVSLRNPEFPRFFFIHEHFERFLTTVHSRYQPAWFFIPVLLATMFPWALFIVRAAVHAWKERRSRHGEVLIFLLIWTIVIFVFFSASHSKLVPYILPVFPPLAIMLGKMFSDVMEQHKQGKAFMLEHTVLALLLVPMTVAALLYPHVSKLAPVLTGSGLVRPGSSLLTKQPILSPAGGLAVACVTAMLLVSLWLVRRHKEVITIFAVLCLGSYLLATVGLQTFMEGIERKKCFKELALLAKQMAPQEGSLVAYGYEQSLPFYTGRRVVLVGDKGELEFGSRQGDQSDWFVDEADFLRLWRDERQITALLEAGHYERISRQLVPAPTHLARKGKKILITKEVPAPVQAPTTAGMIQLSQEQRNNDGGHPSR